MHQAQTSTTGLHHPHSSYLIRTYQDEDNRDSDTQDKPQANSELLQQRWSVDSGLEFHRSLTTISQCFCVHQQRAEINLQATALQCCLLKGQDRKGEDNCKQTRLIAADKPQASLYSSFSHQCMATISSYHLPKALKVSLGRFCPY